MHFQNHWIICSSYDCQPHQQHSPRRYHFPRLLYSDLRCHQACHWCSKACRWCTQRCFLHFQTCRWGFQTCRRQSQLRCGASEVPSGAPKCFQAYYNHSHISHGLVIREPSYSEGWLECPPRVWYSSDIDISKFTLHILSDTPGGFQWLKYIKLIYLLINNF